MIYKDDPRMISWTQRLRFEICEAVAQPDFRSDSTLIRIGAENGRQTSMTHSH